MCRFSNLDGSNRFTLNVFLAHPYGITVFENTVYWTDWNLKSINKTERYLGNNSTPLLSNMPVVPYDIKVVHSIRQPSGM